MEKAELRPRSLHRPKSGGPCPGRQVVRLRWPRVLIVEDNPANMTLATFLLESAGHAVLSATDAEAGLTLARDEQPEPHPDGHPAARHGRPRSHRAAQARRRHARAFPVIALTALAMKGDEERIRAAGCDGYIAKPLDYKSFLATITSHLASHSGRV